MTGTQVDQEQTLSRSDRRRIRTRGAMLDAAEELLTTGTYTSMRIEDIASTADVSVGSVYVHFGSKLGLAAAAVERIIEEASAALSAAYASSESPLEQMVASADAYMRLLLDNPVLVRYFSIGALELPTEGVGDVVAGHVSLLLAGFEDRIRAAVDAGEIEPVDAHLLASFLFGAWNGVAGLALRGSPTALAPGEVEACLKQARDILRTGLERS